MSVVDEVREQIAQRLKELKPVVDEYHQLEAMVRRLADGMALGLRPVRARLAVARRAAPTGDAAGVLAAAVPARHRHWPWFRPSPASPSPKWPKEMGITPNYLYRVLPELATDGKVKKTGKGWEPAS